MAPANTGRDMNNKKATTKLPNKNKFNLKNSFKFIKHTIEIKKLILASIELKPARCKAKIKKSTEIVGEPIKEDKGGYNVQPLAGPIPYINEIKEKIELINNNKKLKLLILGNNISMECK